MSKRVTIQLWGRLDVLAIDAETKLVPSYNVSSNRNLENTVVFITELASRLNNRVQISTNAINSYPEAIELAFGREVDYAQIVKSYSSRMVSITPNVSTANRASSRVKRFGSWEHPIRKRFRQATLKGGMLRLACTLRG